MKACRIGTLCFFIIAFIFSANTSGETFGVKKRRPKFSEYGNVVINNYCDEKGISPVVFPHWLHRAKYTCRLCHIDIGFAMQAGETKLRERENQEGMYCGACHDGETAFGHTKKNCEKCHSGRLASDESRFLEFRSSLPRARYGNGIDWVRAVVNGEINPAYSVFSGEEKPLPYDKVLDLEAEWNFVPPATFPHKAHTIWLDCANCHPDIFNIKKKTTKHFRMKYILDKKFCGVCHLSVAFPLNHCKRCHPGMRER